MQDNEKQQNEEKFVPSGAIAFFLVLVFLGIIIWLSAYVKFLIGL